jgi:hypothetical protein
LAVLALGALAVAAGMFMVIELFCFDCNRGGYEVTNRTDQTLDVYLVIRDREVSRDRELITMTGLRPGQTGFTSLGIDASALCTTGDLVARDASGAEVARRIEPVCNHQEWVITLPPAAPN